jgi:hypothetical protein
MPCEDGKVSLDLSAIGREPDLDAGLAKPLDDLADHRVEKRLSSSDENHRAHILRDELLN